MKKNLKFYFSTLICVILLTGVACSARAADNAVTVGVNPAFFGIDYERKILDKISFELYYGVGDGIIIDTSGYGFGIKYYWQGDSLNGFYAGLDRTTIHVGGNSLTNFFEKLLGEPTTSGHFNYAAFTLGYKKVSTSGFTFDAACLYGFGFDVEEPGISGTIEIGYGW